MLRRVVTDRYATGHTNEDCLTVQLAAANTEIERLTALWKKEADLAFACMQRAEKAEAACAALNIAVTSGASHRTIEGMVKDWISENPGRVIIDELTRLRKRKEEGE